MQTDLDKFYQDVTNDPALYQQFESITDQEGFLKLAVQLGAEFGYNFTTDEVKASIGASTASSQGEYFCLPIGCWHKADAA